MINNNETRSNSNTKSITSYSYYRRNNINNNNILPKNSRNINNNQIKSQYSKLNTEVNNNIIANDVFSVKENINSNNIKNYLKEKPLEIKDKEKNKYISIYDLIGTKCNLTIDLLRYYFHNYEPSKTSKKKMGLIKSYAVNTYQGIVRDYNEDRVSIMVNMNKPRGYYKRIWPRVSFFGIYDGHGGETCSEYLRDNLHDLIVHNNQFFPENIIEAIKLAFNKAEKNFIEKFALDKNRELKDKSGSCAVILLLVENKIYAANVGDSRCLLSMNNGDKIIEVTKDHKPNSPEEKERIKKYGGRIYQTETYIKKSKNVKLIGKKIIGPYRVSPGGLSVSRTIGDVEAKLEKYGGNENVVISKPDIFEFDLNKDDIDFFVMGCDGIFDQLTSEEVINCAWMIYNEKDNILVNQCKDIHNQSGLICDLIMKSALARKSFDNVTCLFISFKELGNIAELPDNNIADDNLSNTLSNKDKNKSYNYVNNNIKNVRRSYTSSMTSLLNNGNKSKNKENFNINNNKNINSNGKNTIQYNINSNKSENKNDIKKEIRVNNINKDLNQIGFINDKSSNITYQTQNNNNNGRTSIRKSYLLNKRNSNTKINEIKYSETVNTLNSSQSKYVINSNSSINQKNNNQQNGNNINTNIKDIKTLTRRNHNYISSNNYK